MEMRRSYTFCACTMLIHIFLPLIEAQKVPAIFVFGDSYGDTGNNNYIGTVVTADSPPYGRDFVDHIPTGRFSNGQIMPDYFAAGLGIRDLVPAYLDPSVKLQDLLTGVSFASSGAGLDNSTAKTLHVIPVWKQLKYFQECTRRLAGFVGEERTANIVKEAIHFITIGTNDFIANYYLLPYRSPHFTVSQYKDLLLQIYKGYIQELYGLNARRVALINLPPLGCLPVERTLRFYRSKGRCVENINEAASEFNAGLEAIIEELKYSLPELKIVSLDYHGLILDVIRNPAKYGTVFYDFAVCVMKRPVLKSVLTWQGSSSHRKLVVGPVLLNLGSYATSLLPSPARMPRNMSSLIQSILQKRFTKSYPRLSSAERYHSLFKVERDEIFTLLEALTPKVF